MKILSRLRRFHEDTVAATATEYAVMLAVIMIGIIAALQNLGREATATFQRGADVMSVVADETAAHGTGADVAAAGNGGN